MNLSKAGNEQQQNNSSMVEVAHTVTHAVNCKR